MKYAYDYSPAECRLIAALNMEAVASNPHCPPLIMYHWMALACFRDNRNDNVSTSVRHCLRALETPMQLVRGTDEFDKLILV